MDDVMAFIPWRDCGNRYRRKSIAYVRDHLQSITGLTVHFADGGKGRFSVAAARNNAIRRAKSHGAAAAIICDADILLDKHAVKTAVCAALYLDAIVLPYTVVRYLQKYDSHKVIKNEISPMDATEIESFDCSVGGAYVSAISTWERVGGQDERFAGWGGEDTAFSIAAIKLNHALNRVDGVIHHLWHPSAEKSGEAYEYNRQLLQRYIDSEDLTELIAGRAQKTPRK